MSTLKDAGSYDRSPPTTKRLGFFSLEQKKTAKEMAVQKPPHKPASSDTPSSAVGLLLDGEGVPPSRPARTLNMNDTVPSPWPSQTTVKDEIRFDKQPCGFETGGSFAAELPRSNAPCPHALTAETSDAVVCQDCEACVGELF